MENKDRDYIPGQWNIAAQEASKKPKRSKDPRKGVSAGVFVSLLCLVTVLSILFTYTLTSASKRDYYTDKLLEQQQKIQQLEEEAAQTQIPIIEPTFEGPLEQLQVLAGIFNQYSYYAGTKTEEELMTAVLKAYAAATGDLYAEYYTEEEYKKLTDQNNGNSEGIGVSVIQDTLTVNGYEYQVFQVISIFKNAPAENSELRVGDYIYCIKVDGTYQTIAALGGYTSAINYVRGEKGTTVEFAAFRGSNGSYQTLEISVVRDSFETVSVNSYRSETDSTVGVIRISNFDLTTPHQFKEAVKELQGLGVTKFVFDVRNNPGGDLQSIKAVLTYFLQKGDLILSAIDKEGNKAASYYAESMSHSGSYSACNVLPSEIGMFANLDTVVLCNENTASAAEVFTATLRDYGLATIVGETTFGKGIMQSYIPMSWFGEYSGYAKMTTYAYVTKCGITYHDIGIQPSVEVELSEEAKQYNIYVLPQSKDNQLQAAFAQFKS